MHDVSQLQNGHFTIALRPPFRFRQSPDDHLLVHMNRQSGGASIGLLYNAILVSSSNPGGSYPSSIWRWQGGHIQA